MTDARTVAFVRVENAGRSQLAAAVERAVQERGLVDRIDVVSGGTDPAAAVHPTVVAAMREVGLDFTGRSPRLIRPADLLTADIVVTMGCSADDVCPATWLGDARDWPLDDSGGQPIEAVRRMRDDIAAWVDDLLDEVLVAADGDRPPAVSFHRRDDARSATTGSRYGRRACGRPGRPSP